MKRRPARAMSPVPRENDPLCHAIATRFLGVGFAADPDFLP